MSLKLMDNWFNKTASFAVDVADKLSPINSMASAVAWKREMIRQIVSRVFGRVDRTSFGRLCLVRAMDFLLLLLLA